MNGTKARMIWLIVVGVFATLLLTSMGVAAEVPRMSKEELKPRIGTAEVVILDVRTGGDWNGSDRKIQGAVREDPVNVDSWKGKYPKDKTLVLYCA